MKGHLLMSAKERQRLVVIERAVRGEMALTEAALSLGVSYRQVQRVIARYRVQGDAGLVHRGRGRPSGRAKDPQVRSQAVTLFKERYPDFGPTLASETLFSEHGLRVHPETLRLWLQADGVWQVRQPKRRHRTWRKRKACFGELVQMDGSFHDWFEGRAPHCYLMSLVDDATGVSLFQFAEQESTLAAMQILQQWIGRYGIPVALYLDRKKVYVTDREPTTEELLAGEPPLTQFGRACQKLSIRIEQAHSPQAKGRVERKHGVCQDRLIKRMRLAGITGIEAANTFLEQFTPSLNAKFAVKPQSDTNLHRPIPQEMDLRSVFCREETRALARDNTLRYHNRWLQLDRQAGLPNSGSRVTVQEWQDQTLHLRYHNRPLHFHELLQRPQRPVQEKAVRAPLPPRPPAPDHPWRTGRPLDPDPREVPGAVQELANAYFGIPTLWTPEGLNVPVPGA